MDEHTSSWIVRVSIRAAAVGALAAGLLPATGSAALLKISPDAAHAGARLEVTVSSSACNATTLQLAGGIIPASPVTLKRRKGAQQFGGQIAISAAAATGAHALGVRCGGGNLGSLPFTVKPAAVAGGPPEPVQLVLGRTYAATQSAAEGDKVYPQVSLDWGDCVKAGGSAIDFGPGDFYPAGSFSERATFKLKDDGRFREPEGLYVSPVGDTGSTQRPISCKNASGGTIKTSTIRVTVTRSVIAGYHPDMYAHGPDPSSPLAFYAVHPGDTGIHDPAPTAGFSVTAPGIKAPVCRDPALSLTLKSPGLSPSVQTFSHTIDSDGDPAEVKPKFYDYFKVGDIVAVAQPGDYPLTIVCGTGIVASGTLRVIAFGSPLL